MSKRNCVFTGKPSDFKLKMNSSEDDRKNWAKDVPCCKEYVKSADLLHRALNEHEMRLVELFYEQELAKLRVSNIDAQMFEIRLKMDKERMNEGMDKLVAYSQKIQLYDDKPLRPRKITREDIDLNDEEYDKYIYPTCQEDVVSEPDMIIIDDPGVPLPKEVWETKLEPTKVLTEESDDVKVEKKIVKKQTLWD